MERATTKTGKASNLILGLGLLLITALLDYITGYQMTILLFYLVPVLFVYKKVGQQAAIVMSFLSGIAMVVTDMIAGEVYTDMLTPFWNMAVRIAILLLVVGLVSTRDELERLVEQRTQKLREEMQESARLQNELLAASEREQRRIGHDLHDSLGQHLTATAFAGKLLSKKLAAKTLPEKAAADQIVKMVEDGIELTRQLARSLHPVELEGDSFITSLGELAANISGAFNVTCTFECPQPVALNDPVSNIHIYRIVQEAVSNAIRHGHAKKIVVRIEPADAGVRVTITDNGAGLPADLSAKKGMGRRNMSYRANMIGATFAIERATGGGTVVSCTLPPAKISTQDET